MKYEHQQPKEYIRPEVMAFAKAMEDTLRKHDDKGGWDECSIGELYEGVKRELKEAEEAWNSVKKQPDYYHFVDELVDVANFCMMCWDHMHFEEWQVRSHPHPTPARTAEHMQSAYAHGVMDGERKAREDDIKALDSLVETRKSRYEDKDEPESRREFLRGVSEGAQMARRVIKSLRSTQQQAGEP